MTTLNSKDYLRLQYPKIRVLAHYRTFTVWKWRNQCSLYCIVLYVLYTVVLRDSIWELWWFQKRSYHSRFNYFVWIFNWHPFRLCSAPPQSSYRPVWCNLMSSPWKGHATSIQYTNASIPMGSVNLNSILHPSLAKAFHTRIHYLAKYMLLGLRRDTRNI